MLIRLEAFLVLALLSLDLFCELVNKHHTIRIWNLNISLFCTNSIFVCIFKKAEISWRNNIIFKQTLIILHFVCLYKFLIQHYIFIFINTIRALNKISISCRKTTSVQLAILMLSSLIIKKNSKDFKYYQFILLHDVVWSATPNNLHVQINVCSVTHSKKCFFFLKIMTSSQIFDGLRRDVSKDAAISDNILVALCSYFVLCVIKCLWKHILKIHQINKYWVIELKFSYLNSNKYC